MPYSSASRDFDPRRVHGEITAPAHPDRVNDAVLGRRLAAWPGSMPSSWRSRMSARSNSAKAPITDCNSFAIDASVPVNERQVLVIKFDANSSGRQLLGTSREIGRRSPT